MRLSLEPQTRGLFNPAMPELQPPLIVAVDDEADDIFFLRRTIGKTGFAHQFQPFSNGEAAIAALGAIASGETPVSFPLICFLDIKMTAMTGFDLLRWIRGQKNLDALPVLMYSSSDHPADVEQARELGAQGYLKKYPSVGAMRTVLEEATEFALAAPPKKTFLQWSYRFVDAADALTVK
jgi:CheY-like chemotaxis protein